MSLKLRQPYLRHALALPDAGTLVEPINIQDSIVDFYIRMYAQNGASHNIRNPIKCVLDRIDIVDGSDVLFSLNSYEILALSFYHYKESLEMGEDERPDQYQYCDFNIPLGLGRVDPVVAFDPTQFANPQLVLHWDLENVRDTGATGYVHDSLCVDIMADVIDVAPTRPSGYLMTKELLQWISVDGAQQRIDLPTDYAYRTMFLRANHHCMTPYFDQELSTGVIEKVRHDCDEQKYIPFEIYGDDWKVWDKKWYGFWHQGYWFFVSGGSTAWRDLNLRANLAVAGSGIVSGGNMDVVFPSTCMELELKTAGGSDHAVHVKADGTLPCGTFAWPYGDPDEPNEWLQIMEHDRSRLTVDQEEDDCSVEVFLTQYRTY